MRLYGWFVLALVSLWLGAGLKAQPPQPWTAWLYAETGEMIQIDSNGNQLAYFTLPTVMGHDVYPGTVAVSPDGGQIAYSVYSSSMNTRQFFVYDVASSDITAVYTPPPTWDDIFALRNSASFFSDSGTAVAYGYIRDAGGFVIVVLDTVSGAVLFTLDSSHPTLAAAYSTNGLVMPYVQAYTGAQIHFTPIFWATEGLPEYDSYVWDLISGEVTQTTAYPVPGSDRFVPTGEVVSATFDGRLPNVRDSLMFPFQQNALHVYSPSIGGRFPFFTGETSQLSTAKFIENGRRVLVRSTDALADTGVTWLILERNGSLHTQMAFNPTHNQSIYGMPQGFIYTGREANSAGIDVTYVNEERGNYVVDSTDRVWTASVSQSDFRLVWAGPQIAGAAFEGGWTQLAPPVIPPGIGPVPTATPLVGGTFIAPPDVATPTPLVPRGVLTPGGVAVINTTEGDRLNMRSGPGITLQRIARLANGTRVDVLEGPVGADGFIWWRVRIPAGTEGWVVQAADGVETLIPIG